MSLAAQQIRALERKVEELQAEVDYWHDLCRLPERAEAIRLRRTLGLKSPVHAVVLRVLAARKTMSHDMILSALGVEKHGNYYNALICEIRKAPKPHGITIRTIWGWGYEVEPGDREKLRRLLDGAMEREEQAA